MTGSGFGRMYRFRRHGKGLLTEAAKASGARGLGRGMGRGLLGFALPAAIYLIQDLTSPDGKVIPFVRRLLGKPSTGKIIDADYELVDDQDTKQLNTHTSKEE
ncbi:MAG: hypothetical protein ACP5G0_08665 [Desulfomonilia bacterium]